MTTLVALSLGTLRPACFGQGAPPTITMKPQDQTVLAGNTASFTVVASSTLALSYQWRFYGVNIVGATNAMLTLYNVQPGQAGIYSVQVQNTSGAVVSSNATLTVNLQAFFANDVSISIPDSGAATPYPSTIHVSNLPGTVAKVTVALNGLSHNFPDDVDILLVGPTGDGVVLMSDVGDSYRVGGLQLGFDDAQPASLPDDNQITSGIFRPSNYDTSDLFLPPAPPGPYAAELKVFNGTDPNGPWTLYVMDDANGNPGFIQGGWRLNLTITPPAGNYFMVTLDGNSEVPPTTSPATGSGMLALNPNGTVNYNIGYSGLVNSFTAAHIHGPAGPGTNTPPLFPLNNTSNGPRAGTLRGTVTSYSGQQLWELRSGLQYVDVHSATYQNGEIRGQILPLPLPVITQQPQSQTASVGDKITFYVIASSPAPLSYQWRAHGTNIPNAIDDTLTLPSVQASDAGDYDVMVSNAAGTVTSARAVLTVLIQPGIELVSVPLGSADFRMFDNFGPRQDGRQIPCGIIGISPRWLGLQPEGDGLLIVDTLGSDIDTIMATYVGTNLPDLRFLDCDDNGGPDRRSSQIKFLAQRGMSYMVEADGVNGEQGMIQLNWRLGVPPVVTEQPKDQTVMAGETVIFKVAATGIPSPAYHWLFNGTNVSGGTSDTLMLKNVRPDQAGIYQAVVHNFVGMDTSAPARLEVRVALLLSEPAFKGSVFGFRVTGPPGITIVIETSPDLSKWFPIFITNTPDGTVDFMDPEAGSFSQRFYRAGVMTAP